MTAQDHKPGRRSVVLGALGIGALAGTTAGAAPAAAAETGHDLYTVDVRAFGADDTGTKPSDQAFRDAAAALLSAKQADQISGYLLKKILVIPPGNYLLTQPDSLLPGTSGTTDNKVFDGITITGYGKRITRITYSPAANDTTLWTNDRRYKNIRISGITFTSTNPTSSFNYAYSAKDGLGVQDTWYTDVEWRGAWKRGIGLDGGPIVPGHPSGIPDRSDLNSEMGFDHCDIGGSYSEAFLTMGMGGTESTQQDQFLNYWFRECKVEFDHGVFVRNRRGGSMNFIGGSYILIDKTKPGTFFELTGDFGGRADSVMRLYAQGIRFELRSNLHKVIDSSWYKGSVSFVSCDDTAQGHTGWAAGTKSHVYRFNTSGSRGPLVRYTDCALMGYHEVATASTATTAGKLIYDGCRFRNNAAATGATGMLRWTGTATPRHEVRDCINTSATYVADVKYPAV
ncbi:hypothetical protein [Longispora albida]|uniref:hypothetical protein n=1 Tax=Longispora albida TaxID=203523 RepID=UPI0003785A6E|nr:hypothetical protein [Longispora albida]